jgi:N-acetylglutamate synthase-like GNAT family acetyltransferase
MTDSVTVEGQVAAARLSVRGARPADHGTILELTGALDLTYPAQDLSCFWVAELDGVIVGIAELKDFERCSLLSCVGVREDFQGRGIGRELVDHVVREARHAVYLYTLVPGFFRKAGFRAAVSLPPDLPPRSIYGCTNCDPSLCLCMMRPREDT